MSNSHSHYPSTLTGMVALFFTISGWAASPTPEINFTTQIRPILSEHCFQCHGPDQNERKGGVRLDLQESAFGTGESGATVIAPGKPADSELIARILSTEEHEVMPPSSLQKPLSEPQKQLLKSWVESGASYRMHWSFESPRRSPPPVTSQTTWPRNEIDRFILARLEQAGLSPSPEADPATLIRRITFDLTGLPPTPGEVAEFLADSRPDAYERLVDRLLNSPHYGERMALDWLDSSRYADTHGYHIDSGRDMTRWREYVIDSFSDNRPFDQFIVEQLAGDLLPNPTVEQQIASGFQRNHMINYEGGAIPEEYHNAYIVDRVNTFGTIFLGLSIACSQCHDHKYDPISQKEYYQLYSYFYNIPENGLDGRKGNAPPYLQFPTEAQTARRIELDNAVKSQEEKLASDPPELADARKTWEQQVVAPPSPEAKPVDSPSPPPEEILLIIKIPESERTPEQTKTLREHYADKVSPLIKQWREALKKLRDERQNLEYQIPSAMVMQEMPEPRETFVLLRGQYDRKGEKVTAALPAVLPPLPAGEPNNRLGLARWLITPEHPLTARVLVNRYWQLFFGTGLVKTSEEFGSQGDLPSHPELLDWLAVNFREGDAYSQHPWDMKRLVRLLVTSATYRQASHITPTVFELDPENRLLGRAPRLRLSAEFIRDQALAASGLLNYRIGGLSVSPYQPAGIWEELTYREDNKNFSAQIYSQDHGSDLYRRTMYTFWKRTAPPPTLVTFDAPDRETCTVKRARTNTPLQALILMNDPTYVEAHRKLAERTLISGGASLEEKIQSLFHRVLARPATDRELATARTLLEKQFARYQQQPEAAEKLLKVGESPRSSEFSISELAAWTILAGTILNLDEAVTRN